jgi:hypothetical protein
MSLLGKIVGDGTAAPLRLPRPWWRFKREPWWMNGRTDRRSRNLIGICDNGNWWLPSKTRADWWDRRYERQPRLIRWVYRFESWLAGGHAYIESTGG